MKNYLQKELLQFNPDLGIKPVYICRTKSDLNVELSKEWNDFEGDVIVISSVSRDGLDELISKLSSAL